MIGIPQAFPGFDPFNHSGEYKGYRFSKYADGIDSLTNPR